VLKEEYDEKSPTEREESVKELVQQSVKTAEISQVVMENIGAPDQPFIYKFHIRIPDYAQKTGKRLFLQPAFFQKGDPPRFTASERTHPIYFHYSWKEEDQVTVELPEGYTLELPQIPAPLTVGDITEYEVKATIEGNKLTFQRNLFFDKLMFAKEQYPSVKAYFDACHEGDNTTLTLKQTAPPEKSAGQSE